LTDRCRWRLSVMLGWNEVVMMAGSAVDKLPCARWLC
jgi:hypothetical protein